VTGNWNIDGPNYWKMPLAFMFRFSVLAPRIIIEAAQAICSILIAGLHSDGFDSRLLRTITARS
jgi:hypothetical protein